MQISEFFPNPENKDIDGEFIELFNDGISVIDLMGWKIKDASGKIFIFQQKEIIGPQEYLALFFKKTKISLNNNGEILYLYDKNDVLIDKAEYSGIASPGTSYIRSKEGFIKTFRPTPGSKNIFVSSENVSSNKATKHFSLDKKSNRPINENSQIFYNVNSIENQEQVINSSPSLYSNIIVLFIISLILAFIFRLAIKLFSRTIAED
jgi:hypothetical protein